LDILNKEKNIYEKIILFKEVIYIFFRIESLNNFYEENIANNDLFNKEHSNKKEFNQNNIINYNNLSNNNEKNLFNKEREINELAEEENLKKNISRTLITLHKFLRDNDVESWIRCLVEESAYFKSIKDLNGYVFTIINQYAANYYKFGKTGDFKNTYQTIINNYGERAKDKNKDKSPEKILLEMKSRIELAIDIYRRLVEMENELFNLYNNRNSSNNNDFGKNKLVINAMNFNNDLIKNLKEKETNNDFKEKIDISINNIEIISKNPEQEINKNRINNNNYVNENQILHDENNSNKFLIKLFFKHAIYQINKESNNINNNINNNNYQNNNLNENLADNNNLNNPSDGINNISRIKSQIELALKLLENDEFDVSSIDIFKINSDVTKSLKILFQNMKMIRTKKEMQKALKIWKINCLGYEKLSEHMKTKYDKNKIYFKGLLDSIIQGI